jgi:hypothetical protein
MSSLSPTLTSSKKLLPGLFQIAAQADSLKFPRLPSFDEIMLNPKKLEAILKTIARMEKPAPRRTVASSFQRKLR